MSPIVRTATLCLVLAGTALASKPATGPHLTIDRVIELSATPAVPSASSCQVTVAPFGSVVLSAATPEGVIQKTRDFTYPTEYSPQQPPYKPGGVVIPITPTAFATTKVGWTIHLTAQPFGKLVEISGVADYATAAMVNGGYGEMAGPIYAPDGKVITPNKLDQPRIQTTTTQFHLFALPGKSYEVTLFRGDKREKHLITVTAQ